MKCSTLGHRGKELSIIMCDTKPPESKNGLAAQLAPFFFNKIPVNTANQDVLQSVDGIGPYLSANIVEYRDLHGPIMSAEDMCNISGVSEKRSLRLAKHLSFE